MNPERDLWIQTSFLILSSADSCRIIHIYAGYILTQWITDAMTKTLEDFFNKIFTSHFIARVRKGCVGFYCERELETEHNWNILTPKLWSSALCLSRSPGLLNRSPGVDSVGCWLSLLHLVSLPLQLYSPEPNSTDSFCSIRRPYITFKLPRGDRTRLHASAISSDIWRSGCVTSANFGMACVIVIERK